MKGVQCYELFGGIALKNHTFFQLQTNQFNNKATRIYQDIQNYLFSINLYEKLFQEKNNVSQN